MLPSPHLVIPIGITEPELKQALGMLEAMRQIYFGTASGPSPAPEVKQAVLSNQDYLPPAPPAPADALFPPVAAPVWPVPLPADVPAASLTPAVPLPPPVVSAAPVPLAGSIPPPNAPAVDGAGYPWDERIHASTKACNADGTWRAKRGIDKGAKAAVEQELRARYGIAPAAEAPNKGAVPTAVPAPPPAALAPPAEGPNSAQELFIYLGTLHGQGKLSNEELDSCLDRIGVKALSDVMGHPTKCGDLRTVVSEFVASKS